VISAISRRALGSGSGAVADYSAQVVSINLSNTSPAAVRADALIVGVAKGAKGLRLLAGAEDVNAAYDSRLTQALTALGATGKTDEVTKTVAPTGIAARSVVAVGIGSAPEDVRSINPETLRRAAGAAARALSGVSKAAIALPAYDARTVGAVAEGVTLGAYAFDRYKRRADSEAPLAAATIVSPSARDKAVKAAVTRAAIVTDAVNLTRDWVNTPPDDLSPSAFADIARTAAAQLGLEVDVLDQRALKRKKFGGILGVGQGSANPPRFVRIGYRPAKSNAHVAFVGKGITFDSGGLSIKTADGMVTMKSDMAGAAAVITATMAAAQLALPVRITTYAPMAENMPSGTAQRPSDVLTMYGGKTVEVLNTDAEGRLVMADALVRAGEDAPDVLIDVATLTGACVIALGTRVGGIMSNDDELQRRLQAIATDAGEQMWPLPLPDELREKLDSPIADIANVGDRYGAALAAGIFLKDFVPDGVRWAHLDIAGPAFNNGSPYGYTPKGGTGFAVRTLVRSIEELAAEAR
jgi:leucyl aminopeptidase